MWERLVEVRTSMPRRRLGARDVAFGMGAGQAISRPLRKMIIVQAYKSTENQLHIFKLYTLSIY